MKKIKCVAIDDEPIALLILSEFCARMGNVELVTFSDPRTGLENIRSAKPDVVFLDIEMNEGQMLEDVRLAVNGKCPVHFLGGGGGKLTPPDVIIDHVKKLCGGEEA